MIISSYLLWLMNLSSMAHFCKPYSVVLNFWQITVTLLVIQKLHHQAVTHSVIQLIVMQNNDRAFLTVWPLHVHTWWCRGWCCCLTAAGSCQVTIRFHIVFFFTFQIYVSRWTGESESLLGVTVWVCASILPRCSSGERVYWRWTIHFLAPKADAIRTAIWITQYREHSNFRQTMLH